MFFFKSTSYYPFDICASLNLSVVRHLTLKNCHVGVGSGRAAWSVRGAGGGGFRKLLVEEIEDVMRLFWGGCLTDHIPYSWVTMIKMGKSWQWRGAEDKLENNIQVIQVDLRIFAIHLLNVSSTRNSVESCTRRRLNKLTVQEWVGSSPKLFDGNGMVGYPTRKNPRMRKNRLDTSDTLRFVDLHRGCSASYVIRQMTVWHHPFYSLPTKALRIVLKEGYHPLGFSISLYRDSCALYKFIKL